MTLRTMMSLFLTMLALVTAQDCGDGDSRLAARPRII